MAEAAAATAPCRHPGEPEVVLRGRDRLLGLPGEFAVVRCRTCGLAYTVPPMSETELAAHYPPSYPPYAGRGDSWRQRLGAPLDRMLAELGNRRGVLRPLVGLRPGRVLDVGCGRGHLAAWLAGRGWEAAGVEPSAEACREAASLGVQVHHGTLDGAPFPDDWFDAVVFNHSLEHIPDPLGALEGAGRLLHPGGSLVVAVPNFASGQRRVFGGDWFHLDLPRHRQHLEPRTLSELVRRAGMAPGRPRITSSLAGLAGSLRYRAGRSGAPPMWSMYATYPVAAVADRLWSGDTLQLHAVRPAATRGAAGAEAPR